MLNGADGLGQIAAGLVEQGLTIFESIKQNLVDTDAEYESSDYPSAAPPDGASAAVPQDAA